MRVATASAMESSRAVRSDSEPSRRATSESTRCEPSVSTDALRSCTRSSSSAPKRAYPGGFGFAGGRFSWPKSIGTNGLAPGLVRYFLRESKGVEQLLDHQDSAQEGEVNEPGFFRRPGLLLPAVLAPARRVAIFYSIAILLFVPWVIVLAGQAISHVSFLFFAALPPALALAAVLPRGAASHAAGKLWAWRPTLRSAGWVLASFVWLSAAGAV